MAYFSSSALAVLLLVTWSHCGEASERIAVKAYLVQNDETRIPWQWDTHHQMLIGDKQKSTHRRKRSAADTQVRITIETAVGEDSSLNLHLRPKSHPVTPETIVEWVGEDGQSTVTRGIRTDHCWFTGSVEDQTDSKVTLGVCHGLSGLILSNNQTLLLEPVWNESNPLVHHVIYPAVIDLHSDQDYGNGTRLKRNINHQIDYDEEGNEITDTVHPSDWFQEYEIDRGEEDEDEANNSVDGDDVLISDTYSEIDEYDVHLPPLVTEAKSLAEAENVPNNFNRTTVVDDKKDQVDGYSVDKLWEGDSTPQAVKRKKPVATLGEDPPKFLELALAVDHTVIKFHSKQRVQQYVLTLLNIVSAIYEDTSLEANLRLVVSRLVFYEDRKQGQVREGNSKRSLENVNAWNSGLLRNAAADWPHDIAVWLTRFDLGGPSGYAPVAGVCDPDRSCSLNRDEGLTSAFIIAHEVGHVLGFSHDGDLAAGNDCSDEALQGSVMAPMVAATFSRFHWSRCTHWEYHFKQHNWKCLKNQPNTNNDTLVQSAIQYSYSLDEQCRMEFGEGYMLCRTFALSDPCSHLWCGHKSSPQLCKTKKGPPLEGTPCGQDKWCIKGYCESIGKRNKTVGPVVKNPRHGNWSNWTEWNACSRTCNVGVRFRTRKCNNPSPANGGKNCKGQNEEYELCNTHTCPQWTDFRAEQCASIAILAIDMNEYQRSLTWLPWEGNNPSVHCQLSCVALQTGQIHHSMDNVIDGTLCSYEDSHGICIQGQCQAIGCDKKLASSARENECGVCNGKAADCTVASRHYSGAPRPPHRRVVVIPRGARDIRIKEELPSSNRLALKGRNSNTWILNGTFPITDDMFVYRFIAAGARFTYHSALGLETMQAKGPLLTDLTLMVVPGAIREHANITVTWNTPPKSHRKKNPLPSDGKEGHFWELAGWSVCSRSCGGGTQTQVWYCRDRHSDQVFRRKHCSHLNEPQIQTRLCNTFSCDFRWVTGPWEGCSQTCGTDGIQMRMIYCVRTSMVTSSSNATTTPLTTIAIIEPNTTTLVEQQSTGNWTNGTAFHEARRLPEVTDDAQSSEVDILLPTPNHWKPTIKDNKKKLAVENEILHWNPNAITDPALCRDQVPIESQACNRIPCPGIWTEKSWSKCSATCGGLGHQEMQFSCLTKSHKIATTNKDLLDTEAAYVEPADEENWLDTSSAYAFKKPKTTSSKNNWKTFICGPKPQLSRSCKSSACPAEPTIVRTAADECLDDSIHCRYPVLHRYCILPQFRQLCCQTCSNNYLP